MLDWKIVQDIEQATHWVARGTHKSAPDMVTVNKVYPLHYWKNTDEFFIVDNQGNDNFGFDCVFKGKFVSITNGIS